MCSRVDDKKVDEKKSLDRVALGITAMFGFYWCYLLFRDDIPVSAGVKTIIGLISLYGVGFFLFMQIIKPVSNKKYMERKLSGKELCLCFLLQFTAIMVLSVVTNVFIFLGVIKTTPNIETTSAYSLFMLLVFNPVLEELVFRKLIAHKLLQYGELFYMVVSSFCFAIVHGVSLGIPQILYTYLLGMIWSYIMVKTGDIKIVIVMHALSNLFGSIVIQFLMGISMMVAGMYSILLMILGATGLILFERNKKLLSIDGKNTLMRQDILKEVFSSKGIWIYSSITILFIVIL